MRARMADDGHMGGGGYHRTRSCHLGVGRYVRQLLVVALAAGACRVQEPTLDEGSPPPGTASSLSHTETGKQTGHTGDTGTVPPLPCDFPGAPGLRLCGDERGDFTGRWLDVADIDGDGIDELLVSESWDFGQHGIGGIHSAVHLVHAPFEGGNLHEVAYATFEGSGGSLGLDYWGSPAAFLAATNQVVVGGQRADSLDYPVHLLNIPKSASPTVPVSAEVAWMFAGPPFNQLGASATLSRAQFADGTPALAVGARQTVPGVPGDWAGHTMMYELPISGEFHVLDSARARYLGDPYDRADQVDGRHDLDGDGILDLVVGAYWGMGLLGGEMLGAVAVVLAPPEGVHRIWDIADATFIGVDSGAEFGGGTAVGDLDGDGHLDLLVGAYFGASGVAYVFRGPFAGQRSAADADWAIRGEPGDWLGIDGAIADLDGDGAAELIVGAPRSIYVGTEPGVVHIWSHPEPGTYEAASSPFRLVSGVGAPDAFGLNLEAGDFDGDGAMDLAVGAPRDPTVGSYGGSVTIFSGASLDLR